MHLVNSGQKSAADTAEHKYDRPGRSRVAVKVIDIFENER